ncbi:pectate lyase L [Coprinopsis sp. MPI-PUGE-AT-0042]|nr:pectate lyase L [Coprinopsis sp. MPI-PUGE-AT-0042]
MIWKTTFILLVAHTVWAADFYVSPSGNDSAAGTLAAPFKTIQKGIDIATAGSTVYLRAGTYAPSTNVKVTKSGTSSAPYTLRAYSGEKVVLDGENMPYTPAAVGESLPNGNRGALHIMGAAYWKFYDLEIKNGPYGVYLRDSSNNHFERIITHDNYESGFQIQGASSNNVVLYLDSYMNRDPRKNGESADGFACKEGSGTGNVLRGARLWNNVDDGLDLWEFTSPVLIENTIAWGNGFNRWNFPDFGGDGNGFKLGGGDPDVAGNHIIRNSVAFQNAKKGFIDNGNTGSLNATRNTAWNNGDYGFAFLSSTSTLTGNVGASNKVGQSTLKGQKTDSGNSWNVGGTWNDASFVSVDVSLVQGSRTSSGALPKTNFLVLKSGQAIGWSG